MLRTLIIGIALALCFGSAVSARAQSTEHSSETTNQEQEPSDFIKARDTKFSDEELVKRYRDHSAQAGQRREQAQALLKKKDFAGAEKICLEAIAIEEEVMRPRRASQGNYLLAAIYLRANQNEKALACYRAMAGQTSRSLPLELEAALAYCQMGDYPNALRLSRDRFRWEYTLSGSVVDINSLPSTETLAELHASILLERSIHATYSDRCDEAIEDLEVADRLSPKNPVIHFYLGQALYSNKRDAEAIAHYNVAIARGNGIILKLAKYGAVQARLRIETAKLWKAQEAKRQAEQKTQAQDKTAP